MADKKISELQAATSAASADLLHIIQGGTNKKLTVANLFSDIDTNVRLDGTFALKGAPQDAVYSGTNVVLETSSSVSNLTSGSTGSGDSTYGLGDATVEGQIKILVFKTDGGDDAVVTPSSLLGGTTITFADAGDTATLMWNSSAASWVVLAVNGAVVA
jgi:hypothetical protein